MLQAQAVMAQVISLGQQEYQRYMSVHHSFRRIVNII
ncbi:Uncharacterised protein [Escherichia coli]|nr:hypothetical protein WKG_00422 [Escherichia coli KTE163]EOV44983.1 hypothetical protein A17G_00346 [Escherichia coli KTE221]EQW05172.1 hypothetical protein G897_04808 [Escherichia coli KOEGE 131 (358a)]KDG49342.1 hypothetical protein AF33_04772 [Escherichia coli CHS 77]OYA07450.1 hypothetical protein RW81_04658 [Escherichia coli]